MKKNAVLARYFFKQTKKILTFKDKILIFNY